MPFRRRGTVEGTERILVPLPLDDVLDSLERAAEDLSRFAGSSLLLTGVTGTLGRWLVASLLEANRVLNTRFALTVLTRDERNSPFAGVEGIAHLEGDVRTVELRSHFDVFIHGAATASAPWGAGESEPRRLSSTIVEGTRNMLECAARKHARFVYLSSGAIYGPQAAPVAEGSLSGPDPLDPRSAYGEAKRLAENLCASANASGELEAVILRLFAFIGPELPLDSYFAAGNFIRDGLQQAPITIEGDGSAIRSYLYSGDLAEWCWAATARGVPGSAYNVGSDEQVSILELAQRIAQATGGVPVRVMARAESGPRPYYVPDISRARSELKVDVRNDLDSAIRKTIDWLRRKRAAET